MSDPFRTRRGQLWQAWWRHKDSQVTFGIAMAAVAVLFIVGIVSAFNNARLDSMARNPPVATASAPAASTAPPAETTGSGNVNRPALPAPQNTRP